MARSSNSRPVVTAVVSGVALLIFYVILMDFTRTAADGTVDRSRRTTTTTTAGPGG